jgi:NAD dependent epimerase/dehydratase family enzyme
VRPAEIAGPVNLVAPGAVTGAEFAHTLGAVLHRPALLPVPALALRAVIGGLADEGALASQRVVPRVLTTAGFEFRHPDLVDALRAILSR